VSPGEVRAFLERHGLRASRNLGQNFLVDLSLADRLAMLAGVEPGDTVIEIGTGLGALTTALAKRARRVVSLEIDAGLVRALEAEGSLPENVTLLHADALRFDFEDALVATEGPVRLVTNLPYSISGPALRRILDLRGALAGWSVMLQREVALRLLAQPGSKAYGSLSVLHQLTVTVESKMELSPRCFHPVPKVRSLFLRLVPLADSPLAPDELPQLERVVRAAFGKRRKTLSNALASLDPGVSRDGIAAALASARIDPGARAESVPAWRFLDLARALHEARGGGSAQGTEGEGAWSPTTC
jgi:16S rRNA (adenine1518-N6/adenine1519-N6)-dimethyltransferase